MTGDMLLHQTDLGFPDHADVFSGPTNPKLEDFIQRFIHANRTSIPSGAPEKLVREFFLYGFMTAHEQRFAGYGFEGYVDYGWLEPSVFGTNNGVLAVADATRRLHIRGGESYHGYFDEDSTPAGVEGTLLQSGYLPRTPRVPHSNGESFADEARERLFGVLYKFSQQVRGMREEPTAGLIIDDFSEQKPQAPYAARDRRLPEIVVDGSIFIPGNKDNRIVVYR